MSLLGNQVYANSATPIWLSSQGGSVPTLNVGTLTAGDINLNNGQLFPNQAILQLGVGLAYGAELSSPSGVDCQINTNGTVYFGRKGTNGASTSINPGLTPNTDVVTIGGSLSTQSMLAGSGMAGTGTISVGQNRITINASKVTASSLIFLSRVGAASAGPGAGAAQGILTYRVSDIVPGTSFTVYLTDINGVSINASNVDATFVWMIIN